MNELLQECVQGFNFSGELKQDVFRFLVFHNMPHTAEHSHCVGREARALAVRFGLHSVKAEIAGYLHDISAVFPNSERIQVARQLGIEVLPEEEIFPQIIHQKISVVMAEQIFLVHDTEILSAIGCHTTLKAAASLFDMNLFVADKIEWDQQGTPPYIDALKGELAVSLQHGAFSYLRYLWGNRNHLKVLHPWAKAAYLELSERLN